MDLVLCCKQGTTSIGKSKGNVVVDPKTTQHLHANRVLTHACVVSYLLVTDWLGRSSTVTVDLDCHVGVGDYCCPLPRVEIDKDAGRNNVPLLHHFLGSGYRSGIAV